MSSLWLRVLPRWLPSEGNGEPNCCTNYLYWLVDQLLLGAPTRSWKISTARNPAMKPTGTGFHGAIVGRIPIGVMVHDAGLIA
jgi:hypothetical protein